MRLINQIQCNYELNEYLYLLLKGYSLSFLIQLEEKEYYCLFEERVVQITSQSIVPPTCKIVMSQLAMNELAGGNRLTDLVKQEKILFEGSYRNLLLIDSILFLTSEKQEVESLCLS